MAYAQLHDARIRARGNGTRPLHPRRSNHHGQRRTRHDPRQHEQKQHAAAPQSRTLARKRQRGPMTATAPRRNAAVPLRNIQQWLIKQTPYPTKTPVPKPFQSKSSLGTLHETIVRAATGPRVRSRHTPYRHKSPLPVHDRPTHRLDTRKRR